MKALLVATVLLVGQTVLADDVALAKASFEKFVDLQKANDRQLLDLISDDCSGKLMQSDGKIEIAVDVPKGQFAKSIEAAILQNEGKAAPYEEVEFKASGETINASGFIRYEDPDFKGPFSMAFTKNPAGDMKISSMMITVPLTRTPIKSHALFEFTMPGKWIAADGKKMDIGGGKTMYPGGARGQGGGLAYFAFEESVTKTEDLNLKAFPPIVAGPITKKLIAQGGKEEKSEFLELTPGNKDHGYFIQTLLDPQGGRFFINGIVVRTQARIYVIQTVGSFVPNVNLWRDVAKGFKEL